MLLLLERGVEGHVTGDRAGLHLLVRRLDETELVDASVGGQRRDEADVRAFRRLDGADAAVVRRVHVAHLEARALAGEATRPKGGQTPLVGHLGQRVRLVHELRQLAGPEELLDDRGHGLGVDEIVRHERLDLLEAHALLDRPLHAHQTDAVLVLQQLAHGADATVAEVIDVVDHTLAVLEVHQVADDLEDVALGEDLPVERLLEAELEVQLEAADLGQVVALGVEEQVAEQVGGRLGRRRITRAQAPVDLHDRLLGRLDLVQHQRLTQVGTHVEVVDEEDLELLDVALEELVDLLLRDLLVALEDDLTGVLVHHVVGGHLGEELVRVDGERLHLRRFELLDGGAGELAVLLDDDVARLRLDVARGALTGQQLQLHRLLEVDVALEVDGLRGVVVVEHLLGGATELQRVLLRGVGHRAQGADEHRGRQLAAPIDADVQDVLVVELEVDPRAAVRDDAGVVEQLARRVALALVVVEEGTRAAVQLADHHALGSVDDEGAVLGHQRDFAEVDLLLLHVTDGLGACLLVLVPHDQAHDDLDGCRVGHATLVALIDVVLGLLEVVAHELQRGRLIEVADGEDRLENSLQSEVLTLLGRNIRLEELLVRLLLDVDEVGNVDGLRDLREGLPHSEVVLDLRRHSNSGASKLGRDELG